MLQRFLFLSTIFLFISCSSDDDNDIGGDINVQIDFSEISFGSVSATVSGLNDNNQAASSGLVWGTMENPAIENDPFLLNSVTTGTFQETIYGLRGNTTYNFRAFLQTETGIEYGPTFAVATLETCSGNSFQGDVILRSQKEVDDFDVANVCAINGKLEITSENPLDPVIDISKFSNITSVQTLQIYNNTALKSLLGLQNVETVSRFIVIHYNSEITNIDELSAVTGELEYVSIWSNDNLVTLQGLSGITGLGGEDGSLSVFRNNSLETLGSFENLESLTYLGIDENPSLVSIDFPNLKGSMKGLRLTENGSLKSVLNLGDIDTIELLDIYECKQLENLDGIRNVTTLLYSTLSDTKLRNLDFLSNVVTGDSASFTFNLDLTNFCGIRNAIQNGNFQVFLTSNNAYNPTREDILNGNCSL